MRPSERPGLGSVPLEMGRSSIVGKATSDSGKSRENSCAGDRPNAQKMREGES